MDPDQFLAHHRALHERQRARLLMVRLLFAALLIAAALMVFIGFRG